MTTIVTINENDLISDSRSDINTNFANLNSDKIETSVLDTDTALTANSDSKIATQKAIKTYVATVAATTYLVPTGAILSYGGSSAPSNFLLCDGTAVSRITYADLFSKIGTTYGSGDGSTTFNLPVSLSPRSLYAFETTNKLNDSSGTTHTLSHTISHSNALLIVLCTGNSAPSGVTYGGTAMTLGKAASAGGGVLYYMINPNIGTADIVVTTGNQTEAIISASYYGLPSITLDTSQNGGAASGTTLTLTTTSTPIALVICGVSLSDTSSTSPTMQGATTRNTVVSSNSQNLILGDFSNEVSSATTTTFPNCDNRGMMVSFKSLETYRKDSYNIIKT